MGAQLSFASVLAILRAYGIDPPTAEAIATSVLILASVAPTSATTGPRDLGDVARIFHKGSLERQEFLGHAAEDIGWNMMLAIFADQGAGRSTSITSACYASGGAATTALRHLTHLEGRGLLRRSADQHDHRRSNVELTANAYGEMARMIAGFCVPPPPAAVLPAPTVTANRTE